MSPLLAVAGSTLSGTEGDSGSWTAGGAAEDVERAVAVEPTSRPCSIAMRCATDGAEDGATGGLSDGWEASGAGSSVADEVACRAADATGLGD